MNVRAFRSRYQQGYDSKESLQSSKELSPGRYNDIGDNFRGGTNRERRRSNPDTRTNQLTSNTKRELFRESLCRDLSRDFSREPPRGPKGVPDAPTGPRASSYGDFRSDFSFRGDIRSERGRGRSHGWRDDSRDRGWDPERDYRDRRDERFSTTFRDDRSRDRWGSRDTYSSSRRPLSPQGRGRSPSYSQRDIREPAISDLERTKRVSRDSSLSTGFLSSDIIQPFARTFGKVRGARGRARTGNYDEYHRITGPNRSPADTGWNRRTQPSATPPPPVPAFGSTSNSIPIGTYSSTGIVATLNGSAASIAVPTAPRSERRHNKITTPTSTQTFSEISRRNGVDKQLGNPTSSVNLTSSTSPSISKFDQNKSDYEITKKGEKEISLVQDSNRSSNLISDKILASTHEAFSHHLAARSNTSSHKRHPIIAKGPPVKLDTLLEDAGNTSDSDSGDDFGDEYFEKEISRVKEEISKISLVNPLLPRCEPEVLFLNAFIESDIWNIIETTEFSTLNKCQESKLEKEIQDETSKLLTAVNSVKSKAQIKGLKPNLVTTLELPSAKLLAPENFSPNTTFEYQNKKIELVPATLSHNSNSSEKHSIKDLELHVHRPKRSATKQLDSSTDDLSDAENAAILESVRKRMKTPPITSLPRFKYKPWYEDEVFLKSLEPSALIGVRIYHHLTEVTSQKKRDQEKEKRRWASRYYRYRRFTDRSNDPAAIRSRERFLKSQAKSAAEATAPKSVLASANSKPEGSRRVGSRFATEHELQRVLLQSEKEAKESKDKQDRITRECTATAKEAIIPDMLWDDEEREAIHFEDRSGLISFERSFAILEFGEPIDNFTKEESSLFEKAYFEFPKQWGKIAETLPTRDYKSCIQHYYLVKHPSSLKKKLKDQSKKRKGRQSKVKKEKIVPLINDLSSIRDEEEIPDGEADARSRRPRRAAAPTFNSDLKDQQNEFEATNLALSLAKKPSGNSSSEQNTETLSDPASHSFPSSPHSVPVPLQPSLPIVTATKRKAKISRDKPTKQVKSSQSSVAPPEYQKADSPVTTLSQEYKMQQKSEISSKDCTETENLILKPDSNISYVTPVEQATSLIATNTSNFEKNQPVKTPEMTKISITSKSEPSLTQKNAQQTSSYWSVQEQDIFSTLLGYYGTNWHAISKYMATKTHIMVKNHYQRQVDSGKMKEWEIIAKAADEKLKRGEPTGPIPSPAAMPTRKRIEIPSTSLTRSSYPTDVDEDILNPLPISSSHGTTLQQTNLHPLNSPTLISNNFIPSTQSSTFSIVTAKNIQSTKQSQTQNQNQHGPRNRGPPLGYFETDLPLRQQAEPEKVLKRTLQAVHDAQQEREIALRMEKEQRDFQRHREQQQREQKEQQQKEQQQREQQQREQQQREQQQREQLQREQQQREQQQREQQQREQQQREQQQREQQQREQQQREQQQREQLQREQQQREQQQREQLQREHLQREQLQREQEQREQEKREQQQREQEQREQEQQEQEQREQQQREQQQREQQQREQQQREQQQREQQQREQQQREQQQREQQQREQQQREQQQREQQQREQQQREQQQREQQQREQQQREQQQREQQQREQQQREQQQREQQQREQQQREQQQREQQQREQQQREQQQREQQQREQQQREQQQREQQQREQQQREQQQREQQQREQQQREQQQREQQQREQQQREQQQREQQQREQQQREQQQREQQQREQQQREQQQREQQQREQQQREQQQREQQQREQQQREQQQREQQQREQQREIKQQPEQMREDQREQLREEQIKDHQVQFKPRLQEQTSQLMAKSRFHHELGSEYQLKTIHREVPMSFHREKQDLLQINNCKLKPENQPYSTKHLNLSPKSEQHETLTSFKYDLNCSSSNNDPSMLAPPLLESKRSLQEQQFEPHQLRIHHSMLNSMTSNNLSGKYKDKESPKQALPRVTIEIPQGINSSSRPYSNSGVHKSEVVRKTSNIMSLLNEEEPSEVCSPLKNVVDTSSPLQKLQTTTSYQLPSVSSYQNTSSQHLVPALPQISQAITQPYVQNIQQFSHQIPQKLSPVVKQSRSYIPSSGNYENQGYVPPSTQSRSQKIYQNPSKQSQCQQISSKSPTPIHRDVSRNEIHTIASSYSCSPASSNQKSTSRLKEPSYSKNPSSPLAQQSRSAISPIDLANTDLEYYRNQRHSTPSTSQVKLLSHQVQQHQQYQQQQQQRQHHYQQNQKQQLQQGHSASIVAPSSFQPSGSILQNQNHFQENLRHAHVSHSQGQPQQQQPRSKSVGPNQIPLGHISHSNDNGNEIANQSRQYFTQISPNSHSPHSHINQGRQESLSENRRSRRSSFEKRYDSQIPSSTVSQNSVQQASYSISPQGSISSIYSAPNQKTSHNNSLDSHHTTQRREVTDNYIHFERRLQDEHFNETRVRDQERGRDRERHLHSRH